MKNLNKILAIVICAMMMFSCFACGSSSSNTNGGNNNSGSGGSSSYSVYDATSEYHGDANIRYSRDNAITLRGNTNYTIILSDNATETEAYAAEELSSYIEKATGAKLPIVNEGKIKNISTSMKLISVGNTELKERSGLNYSDTDFNKDGFIQKTVNKTLFLSSGQSQRGHLYAVYDLLEKCLGIKFYTPECEKIPHTDIFFLPILDVVDVPAFGIRWVTYNTLMDPTFSAKSRIIAPLLNSMVDKYGEGTSVYFWSQAHNFAYDIVPYREYGEDHPEWFFGTEAMRGFVPSYGVKADGSYDDSLELNPVDIAFENIKKAMSERNKDCYFFNCSQADTGEVPENTVYRERANKIGNSGVHIQFLNLVCEKLDAWIAEETRPDGLFPDGKDYCLLTFAYMLTEQPPLNSEGKCAVPINEHINIWLAPIGANLLYSINDPLQDSSSSGLLEGWFKCTNNISIWDYYANFTSRYSLYYHPYLTTAPSAYRYYSENGVKNYVLTQLMEVGVGPRSAINELAAYIASKMMWDPFRYDVWELVREYCSFVYGAYSDDVLSIIYNIEDYLAVLKNDGVYRFMNHSRLDHAEFYPLRILDKGVALMDKDIELCKNSNLPAEEKAGLKERLEEFQLMLMSHKLFEYSSYYRGDMSGYKDVSDKFFALIDSTDHYTYFGQAIESKNIFIDALEKYRYR